MQQGGPLTKFRAPLLQLQDFTNTPPVEITHQFIIK